MSIRNLSKLMYMLHRTFIFKTILFVLCANFLITSYAQPFSWVSQLGGAGTPYTLEVVTDADKNVYSVGYYDESVDFDPEPTEDIRYSNGSADGYVQKLTPNNELLWVYTFGGVNADDVQSIDFDDEGNIFITGGFDGTADFDPSDAGVEERTSVGTKDIFVAKLNSDGGLIWVQTFGEELVDYGTQINVTSEGGILVSGVFTLNIDFDSGPGETILSTPSGTDIFYLKLSTDGEFEWAKQIGLAGHNNSPAGMELGAEDEIYITSHFQDSIDLDPGAGVHMLYQVDLGRDMFVSKLTADGVFVWGYGIHGNGSDVSQELKLDSEENVVITGSFHDVSVFNPAEPDLLTEASGSRDCFVLKLDSDGNFLWVEAIGSTSVDEAFGLAIDPADNIIVGGWFTGTVDFDDGPDVFYLETDTLRDAFVYKINEDGGFIDAYSFAGSGYNICYTIAAPQTDLYYVSGYFMDTVDFNPSAATDYLYEVSGAEYHTADVYLVKFGVEENTGGLNDTRESSISLYPNPVINQLRVELKSSEGYTIRVLNNLGELLLLFKGSGEQEELELESLSAGYYFISVEYEDGTRSQAKFVKQ